MKGFVTAVLFLLLSLNGFAQKYDLGKVTIDELKEKQHPKDTSAVAAFLFKKAEVTFDYREDDGFVMVTKAYFKIKIYKKEGYELANQAVKYYNDGDLKERVQISDAVTYNLVDGKIVKSRLKSDGEFDEVINKYWSQKKITMPNVKEGSIIEFQYTTKTKDFSSIDKWKFQSNIPVNFTEYVTYIPEYFTYNAFQKGFLEPKIFKETKERRIGFSETVGKSTGLGNVDDRRMNSGVSFNEHKTVYQLTDVPALNGEAFVNNINNYISSISHDLSKVHYPGSMPKNFSTDWETIVQRIYENPKFGSELNTKGYFEEEVTKILQGLTTRDEKINAIFNYVKTVMKWDGYFGYYCDAGVKNAFKKKAGNSAEINLMLTAMLRYAGLSANPVLISTRSNEIAYTPNANAFNYVIAAVEIENDLILLDATDKNSLPNILPLRDLNWFGRIIRKEGSSATVELMPKTISKQLTNAILSIDKEGKLSGNVREQYFDYEAYSFRDSYGAMTQETYLEELEKSNNGIEVGEYNVTNVKDLYKPVVENYSFTSSNSVEMIGDKMYFSPMLFFAWEKNPFVQQNRQYPIDFGYPSQNKYVISINIPEGYAVESVPEAKSISLPGSLTAFKFNVNKTDKQIQLMVSRDFNSPIIPAEYYESLKQFFDIVVKAETEKVVLKKV
ncbi:transglutaminase domain-containing protein [Flavobacterium pedocola]